MVGSRVPATWGDVVPPVRFEVDLSPGDEALQRAAASAPRSPFVTPAFAHAQQRAGRKVALLSVRNGADRLSCCLAATKQGRLHTTVEVFSLPEGGDRPEFAEALVQVCRSVGADRLVLDTLDSRVHGLPPLKRQTSHRTRCEHVWSLRGTDLWSGLSANHRRNITRARKAGVVMTAAGGDSGLASHMRLADASMARREQRGELVQSGGLQQSSWAVLLETGAGALYQARLGEEVLSSIVVLKARDGAYYHSAGTSAEGMRSGASHLLVFEVAARLSADGLAVFNLGGAEPANEGLYRFKVGFGTSEQVLEAATYQVGGVVRRGVLWLADSALAVFNRS